MSGKTPEVEIAEHEEEIKKLQAKIEAAKIEAAPKYPKHVTVPAPEPAPKEKTITVVVNSEAEEKAALSNHGKGKTVVSENENGRHAVTAAGKR